MSLFDLLCCPVCKADVAKRSPDALKCAGCQREYPIRNGVPIMLEDVRDASVQHEGELGVRPGYGKWKERIILKSLTNAQVVLDFGAGRQALDDPCIIKMDITYNPYVDVVGDIHALPFKSETLDFVFGGAVLEHVRNPRVAIDELWRVMKRGGWIYADWAFMTAYHGYPDHYFNATIHGIKQAFAAFEEIEIGVPPFAGPAWALRSVVGTYLEHFKPATRLEREFRSLLNRVTWHPLDDFDQRFHPDDRFRLSATVYFFGRKVVDAGDSLLPQPVMRAYEQSPELQARYPNPWNISLTDNLMLWAKSSTPDVGPPLERSLRFSKYADPTRPFCRTEVERWPLELMDRSDALPGDEVRAILLWNSRPVMGRLAETWETEGLWGLLVKASHLPRFVIAYTRVIVPAIWRKLLARP